MMEPSDSTEAAPVTKDGEINASIVVSEESEIYHILDEEDEQMMLLETSSLLNQPLIYKVSQWDDQLRAYVEKKEPTYAGINWLVVHLAQRGQPLKITPNSMKFQKNSFIDPESNQPREVLTCSIFVYNAKSGLETPGIGEQDVCMKVYLKDANKQKIWDDTTQDYKFKLKYDAFSQRKSLSKALRNAWKLQFPPDVLAKLVKIAESKGQIKNFTFVKENKKECNCPQGVRNWDYQNNICKTCKLPLPPNTGSSFPKENKQ